MKEFIKNSKILEKMIDRNMGLELLNEYKAYQNSKVGRPRKFNAEEIKEILKLNFRQANKEFGISKTYYYMLKRENKPKEEIKVCMTCNQTKPLSEFHKEKLGKQGVKASCKSCVNAKKRGE